MSYVTFLCPAHGSAPHRELPPGGLVRWALLRSATAITGTDVLAPARTVHRFGLPLACECDQATVVVSRQQMLAVKGPWRAVVRGVLRRYPAGAFNGVPLAGTVSGAYSRGTFEVRSEVRLPGIGSGPAGVRWHLQPAWPAPAGSVVTCDVDRRVPVALARFIEAHGDVGIGMLAEAHTYGSCAELLDLVTVLNDAFD